MKPPHLHVNPFSGHKLYGQRLEVGDRLQDNDVLAAHHGWEFTRNVDTAIDPADEAAGMVYLRPVAPLANEHELAALRTVADSPVIIETIRDLLGSLHEKLEAWR